MAQTVKILLEDDIDGGEAAETLRFGLDNRAYEIDLSTENAEKLRSAMAPFVAASRRATDSTGRTSRPSGAARTNPETKKIRQWAKDNGYTVANRGRIDVAIVDAYHNMLANKPYPSPAELNAPASDTSTVAEPEDTSSVEEDAAETTQPKPEVKNSETKDKDEVKDGKAASFQPVPTKTKTATVAPASTEHKPGAGNEKAKSSINVKK